MRSGVIRKPALSPILGLALAAAWLPAGCSQKPAESNADQAADAAAANAVANETKAVADIEDAVRIKQLEKRVDQIEKQLGELQVKQEIADAIAGTSEPKTEATPPAKK